MSVSREPSNYWPTTHAVDRAKQRDIEWGRVASAIENGEVRPSHKDGCALIVDDPLPQEDHPLGVVVDRDNGGILTVEWRTDG